MEIASFDNSLLTSAYDGLSSIGEYLTKIPGAPDMPNKPNSTSLTIGGILNSIVGVISILLGV